MSKYKSIPNNKRESLDFLYKSITKYTIKKTIDKNGFLSRLKQRREEALSTFLLLYRKKRFFDASLLSGYLLELSARIDYIENGDSKIINTEIACAAISELAILFLMDHPEEQNWEKAILEHIIALEKFGEFVIKKEKNKTEQESNLKVINILKDSSITNLKKYDVLKRNYRLLSIDKIVENYVSKAGEFINKVSKRAQEWPDAVKILRTAYNQYCICKHSNIKSFDLDDEFLKETTLYFVLCIRSFEKKA